MKNKPDGCMEDIFGSLGRDAGAAAEACEAPDTCYPGQPSCQRAKRRKVMDLLAQRVGLCFTLSGHTAGRLPNWGYLLWV